MCAFVCVCVCLSHLQLVLVEEVRRDRIPGALARVVPCVGPPQDLDWRQKEGGSVHAREEETACVREGAREGGNETVCVRGRVRVREGESGPRPRALPSR